MAHSSGGPLADIVVPSGPSGVGFLAEDEQEFADCLHEALSMEPAQAEGMRRRARIAVERFSEEEFAGRIEECFLPFLAAHIIGVT